LQCEWGLKQWKWTSLNWKKPCHASRKVLEHSRDAYIVHLRRVNVT
jgi:hypothetical protein